MTTEQNPVPGPRPAEIPQRPTVVVDKEYLDWLRHGAHLLAALPQVTPSPLNSKIKEPVGFQPPSIRSISPDSEPAS